MIKFFSSVYFLLLVAGYIVPSYSMHLFKRTLPRAGYAQMARRSHFNCFCLSQSAGFANQLRNYNFFSNIISQAVDVKEECPCNDEHCRSKNTELVIKARYDFEALPYVYRAILKKDDNTIRCSYVSSPTMLDSTQYKSISLELLAPPFDFDINEAYNSLTPSLQKTVTSEINITYYYYGYNKSIRAKKWSDQLRVMNAGIQHHYACLIYDLWCNKHVLPEVKTNMGCIRHKTGSNNRVNELETIVEFSSSHSSISLFEEDEKPVQLEAFMSKNDACALLGVHRDAALEDIKKAYFKLRFDHQGDYSKLKTINKAYRTLKEDI